MIEGWAKKWKVFLKILPQAVTKERLRHENKYLFGTYNISEILLRVSSVCLGYSSHQSYEVSDMFLL